MNLGNFASRNLKGRATGTVALPGDFPAVLADGEEAAGVAQVGPGAGQSNSAAPRSSAGGATLETSGATKLKSFNAMPFINRTAVRNFLLERARIDRPHNKFTRVSEETLRDIHEAIRQMLIARVHRTPSKGRTM